MTNEQAAEKAYPDGTFGCLMSREAFLAGCSFVEEKEFHFTREELEKIIGDAFDAGEDYHYSKIFPPAVSDKQQYISSILDKK